MGKLVKGTSPLSSMSVSGGLTRLEEPLENYSLYCVTFEDNPKAAKGTADNTGSFTLTIDAAGIPFGCFVLDSSGKHVADLIFAQGITPGAPLQGSILLTDSADLGTITVDLDKGIAVVDISHISTGTIDSPFDPTGTWNFTCTSPANDPVYSCPNEMFATLFLHRISGKLPDNSKIYGIAIWPSEQHFNTCGRVEGLCSTPNCTSVTLEDGRQVTLDAPDGPFNFTDDSVWAPNALNTRGTCESSAQLCRDVTNVNNSWGHCSDPSCSSWTPNTDVQCREVCYANAYWDFKYNPNYCLRARNYDFTQVPGSPEFTIYEDFPGSRILANELIYTSNNSATFANNEYNLRTFYDPATNAQFKCWIVRVGTGTFVKINDNEIAGTFVESVRLTSGSDSRCLNSSIPYNDIPDELNRGFAMTFRLTK